MVSPRCCLAPRWCHNQLASGEGHFAESLLSRPVDGECDGCAGLTAETMVDHFPEVAAPGCFTIYMSNDVTGLDSGQSGRPAGHQLPNNDFAIGAGSAVDADATEIVA